MKAWAPRLLGALLLAASLGYLGMVAVRHAASFPKVIWTTGAVAALAAATGLYLVMMLAGAVAWFLLLRSSRPETSLTAVLTVCGLAQPGKYLPGNVGQYLGRAVLARQHGVPLQDSALTIVFETAGLIVTAAAWAVFAGSTGLAGSAGASDLWKIVLLAAAAMAAPFLLIYILESWFPELLRKRFGVIHLPRPSISTLGACLALYAASFACGGFACELLARGLFGAGSDVSWTLIVPAFALSWVAGFVTPGAPAGLGIREALLVGGTAPLYGPGIALSTALVFRLIAVLGDGIAFLAGAAARGHRARGDQ